MILESHIEADIPAWGISLREVLISPHAEWSRGLEGKIKCFGEVGKQVNTATKIRYLWACEFSL